MGLKFVNLNKKAMNAIIIILIIIALSLAAAYLLYYNITKITKEQFGDEVSCFDSLAITPSFFIKNACYLNHEEIVVNVERKTDALNIINIKFAFIGDNVARWQITDNKCSDARTIVSKYGGYNTLLGLDFEINYVFKASGLDAKKQVKLIITQNSKGKELSCLVDTRNIAERC